MAPKARLQNDQVEITIDVKGGDIQELGMVDMDIDMMYSQ